MCQAAKRNDINLIIFLLDRLVVGYTSKYQQIDVEQAQDSLEQIISDTHELNAVTVSLQQEFMPRSSIPSFNYVTRLTPTELQRGIKQALENEEFTLYYQPVMSLHTGDIHEFETLLRWHHPHLGLISPQKFMATAEESGLIVPLQRWIIETVCAQLKCWQENPNFNNDIGVSINVPSLQLFQASLVKHLKFNLEEYKIAPHLITWEISEYLIGENPQAASIILPQLKQLGIQLQIDNFGKVASIYGHVKPNLLYQEFQKVKIDRYLVSLIERDQQAWDMLRKIVLELKKQSFSVTVTGIENLSQLNKVKELAGDYGQGNLLSKPLSTAEAKNLMSNNQAMFDKSNLK